MSDLQDDFVSMTDADRAAHWKDAYGRIAARNIDLVALLKEARDHINYGADTAAEHDLVARIDAAIGG